MEVESAVARNVERCRDVGWWTRDLSLHTGSFVLLSAVASLVTVTISAVLERRVWPVDHADQEMLRVGYIYSVISFWVFLTVLGIGLLLQASKVTAASISILIGMPATFGVWILSMTNLLIGSWYIPGITGDYGSILAFEEGAGLLCLHAACVGLMSVMLRRFFRVWFVSSDRTPIRPTWNHVLSGIGFGVFMLPIAAWIAMQYCRPARDDHDAIYLITITFVLQNAALATFCLLFSICLRLPALLSAACSLVLQVPAIWIVWMLNLCNLYIARLYVSGLPSNPATAAAAVFGGMFFVLHLFAVWVVVGSVCFCAHRIRAMWCSPANHSAYTRVESNVV